MEKIISKCQFECYELQLFVNNIGFQILILKYFMKKYATKMYYLNDKMRQVFKYQHLWSFK